MFKKLLFSLAISFFALHAIAEPSPAFLKQWKIFSDAVDRNDAALGCSSGKSALRLATGFTKELLDEATGIVNMVCQRVKEEAIARDALQPGSEMNVYLKENCKKFNAAKERCATAGNYDRCMQLLVPGITETPAPVCALLLK